ncbi:class I SAM-dependent methyltransferase [Cohnella lupini]|uniref:Methyltransferase family protein n=1 Tax=Cohnella lupini TaxID=1294267 RepID=A0A3D9IW52_9BACL|nr:class I SAM-dependent methyltransferase [Cohnella lupini]RED65941.1 methyltransferase family protein [Cohnella lupini]
MINPFKQDPTSEIIKQYRKVWQLEGLRGLHHPITLTDHNETPFTGERAVINSFIKSVHTPVFHEHLIRYDFATRFVSDKIVLDAACGAGFGAKMLEMAEAKAVYAVDISEESLLHAQASYSGNRIHYSQGDVRNIHAFKNEFFDIIVSFETIEHISSGREWIAEAARLLKAGGLFLVSTPNRSITNPGTYHEEHPINPYHHYEYSVSEFVGELLVSFDILELYGQTLVRDQINSGFMWDRQLRGKDPAWVPPYSPETTSHELVPFAHIKNAQPSYVVAVCRKKR